MIQENYLKQIYTEAESLFRRAGYKELPQEIISLKYFNRFILPNKGYTEYPGRCYAMENKEARMPFKKCILEYTDVYEGEDVKVALKIEEYDCILKETGIPDFPALKINAFIKHSNSIMDLPMRWIPFPPFYLNRKEWAKGDWTVGYNWNLVLHPKWAELNEATKSTGSELIPFLYCTLGLMNVLCCKNVGQQKNTNKKAKLIGKALPYDSYYTLYIINEKERVVTGEERTGRSPREHLRRGHQRRQHYKDRIEWIFIEQTIVNPGVKGSDGSPAGRIVKDYAVER